MAFALVVAACAPRSGPQDNLASEADSPDALELLAETLATQEADAESSLVPLALRDTSAFDLGADGILTVALDPGHGGIDPGAEYFGLAEADINWAIACYCAAYLQQYEGVAVALTRAQDECPTLEERALAAVAAGADVLVSLHINASEVASDTGSYAYYPTEATAYCHSETVPEGKALAYAALGELAGLGLANNGAWEYTLRTDRPDTASYAYPGDSSNVTDYFGIIRWPRVYGLPAVLVEHAFLSNGADAALLASETFLQALGEADARAILATYGFAA